MATVVGRRENGEGVDVAIRRRGQFRLLPAKLSQSVGRNLLAEGFLSGKRRSELLRQPQSHLLSHHRLQFKLDENELCKSLAVVWE